jgi:hypothetical protein
MTIDADVRQWIMAEASKKRLKASQFVNSLLAEAMLREATQAPAASSTPTVRRRMKVAS